MLNTHSIVISTVPVSYFLVWTDILVQNRFSVCPKADISVAS